MASAELGNHQRDDGVVRFHQNFHQGITRPEAEAIWRRLTEAGASGAEVESIPLNAEIIALDALGALPEQEVAA